METSMNNALTVESFDLEQALRSESALAASKPSVVRVGDTLICSGSVPMIIPTGGAHVRVVEIRLPLFADQPTVTATVHSPETPGAFFSIYKILTHTLSNQTRIVIAAVNAHGGNSFPYFCDFVVIGRAA